MEHAPRSALRRRRGVAADGFRRRRERYAKRAAKAMLARLGSLLSARTIYGLNGVFNYLHVGWWLRAHGYEASRIVHSRYDAFDLIARATANRKVLYLEFGVAQGVSMRYWAELLRHPGSRLHGFDSFVGLPHDWTLEGHERGYFSTGGRVPAIEDPRVEFFPGWFEDTLPRYKWPDHEVLIAMLDADLYGSTAAALDFVSEHLRPGSFLYFDQFHHRGDELRAFAEFVEETGFAFRLFAATSEFRCVAFECTEAPHGQRSPSAISRTFPAGSSK